MKASRRRLTRKDQAMQDLAKQLVVPAVTATARPSSGGRDILWLIQFPDGQAHEFHVHSGNPTQYSCIFNGLSYEFTFSGREWVLWINRTFTIRYTAFLHPAEPELDSKKEKAELADQQKQALRTWEKLQGLAQS